MQDIEIYSEAGMALKFWVSRITCPTQGLKESWAWDGLCEFAKMKAEDTAALLDELECALRLVNVDLSRMAWMLVAEDLGIEVCESTDDLRDACMGALEEHWIDEVVEGKAALRVALLETEGGASIVTVYSWHKRHFVLREDYSVTPIEEGNNE
jgi:hypothetical protein